MANIEEDESTKMQCLRFLSNPLNFSNSQATMSDLLGPNLILCLVTLPSKGDDGLYKGKQIPRLHKDWYKIETYDLYTRSVSYRNRKTDKTVTEMPLDTDGPFDYHTPMVYYAFYALDPNNHENGYELIGYGTPDKVNPLKIKPTCLPFPEKMKGETGELLPYNPEQFPECTEYPENKNPSLVEFSLFLKENPDVQFFTLKYDDSPEMQNTRQEKEKEIKERIQNSRAPRYESDMQGGSPELFVVPTMKSSNMISPRFWYNGVDDIIDSTYVLDKSGMAFVGKIKEFWDVFTSKEYSDLILRNRDKIVNLMLHQYIEFAKIYLPDNVRRPNWMSNLSKEEVRKYLEDEKKLNPIHVFDNRSLKHYKDTIFKSREELLSQGQITKKAIEFEKKAELQIPYGLDQRNTGLQRFIEEVEQRKHYQEDDWSDFKLNPNFCRLYFSTELAKTLSHTIPGFPINGFEIFRESNSNKTNLLNLFKIIIDSIQPLLVTDGGNIKKPYSKKNRKRYSRKRYSGKNRKRYSRKNRKRYSIKNLKRYIRKNRKLYSRKNI